MSTTTNGPATIRFISAGGGTREVEVAEGATVAVVCESVGESADRLTVSVNGQRATSDTPVEAGSTVISTPKVEGGC